MSRKKDIYVIALLIIVSTLFNANVFAQMNDSLNSEVETITQKLTQALLKPNADELHALSSDQLSYGHSSGKIETQDEFIHTLVSGASVFEEIHVTDQKIDVVDHTAVVRHVLHAKTNDPGKGPASIRLGIMLTWVKAQDNGWKLLARQAFKL